MYKKVFKNVRQHYNSFISLTKEHQFIGITNEWVVDNYFLIIEQKDHIEKFVKNHRGFKYINKNVDLVEIITNIFEKYNYNVDRKTIIKELISYSEKNKYNFLYEELDIISNVASIVLLNEISNICSIEMSKLSAKKIVNKLIDKLKSDIIHLKIDLKDYIDIEYPRDSFLVVYLNDRLKELGNHSNEVFKQLDKTLQSKSVSLRNIINEEHLKETENNVKIANVFKSIKEMDLLRIEDLYNQVNVIEKALKKDKYYSKMSVRTKNMYRSKIIYLAKKEKTDPLEYVKTIIDKYEHIGEYLFPKKKNKYKVALYVTTIAILTLLITWGLAKIFIPSFIIGFIILLLPVSEIVIQIINRVLLEFHGPNLLPRFEFSKGIPDEYKTMVVVPTILKNKEKVEEVFENLEMFYLSNKSANLYFTLLGDACENPTEVYEKDDEIIKAGEKKAERLNKKYKKELFYFVYRKRKFNPSEGTYLGFERKRGALLHFNDLILGNLTHKEKKEYFQVHTFDDFKHDIKYVITLDVDTKLVLNSAQKMVGLMAHPLNKPVLNEKGTKVIEGYGLLQPSMVTDVESTNKSLFTQLYAGAGGFDQYSAIYPNFYQDVFDEGTFMGKGIYDLKLFQQVLKPAFPDNLILSHDLIESNYLRSGSISYVELIDTFPSKYLIDAARRSRWARGDMQITPWLLPKVKNRNQEIVKNDISLLGRWKIFDNIRLGLLPISMLLVIMLALFIGIHNPVYWLLGIIAIIFLPTLSSIIYHITATDRNNAFLKYYEVLMYGNKAILIRLLSVFASIPFNAKLYIVAFTTAKYRMFISKKRLLNWMTAEQAEKTINSSLMNTVAQFWVNALVVIILIAGAIYFDNHLIKSTIIALLFFFGPLIIYIISRDLKPKTSKTKKRDEKYLMDIAILTWRFFKDNMNKENNFLIPDNYQTNRDVKKDVKTSPTNIGLSLTSIISAYELKLIDLDETIKLTEKVITSIEKLPKWNGHLYNWYNIKTMEVMFPQFVSSVDSGNFVASLVVLKEFLKHKGHEVLFERVRKLIVDTEFKHLYNGRTFSVGYHALEGRLEPYSYDRFISESRITSFVAIAKGDVPNKHWFNLDKTLTKYKHKKGLLSWSGTFFEYYMPILYMKSHPNTLLDESYDFAYFTHKEFIKEVGNYPWGISESAYNELDNAQNYKYKTFGAPYLKPKEEPMDRIVISPYSSILAITKFPKEVIKNIKKYNKLKMVGHYGFYDAYDVTDKQPVFVYYSHHQGMILNSIVNLLKDGVIQNYFGSDKGVRAFDILIKEKTQTKPALNLKITKYKKHIYDKEQFETDIRVFNDISMLPELSVLSNSKYSTLINDRGSGFSRFRMIQLNRYRRITEQDYGHFLYIKDLDNNKVWSNTYAPVNNKPESYEVVFSLDNVKFIRTDNDIITTTEIVVTKLHNAEIRKVTFRNNSKKLKTLELTTYSETILTENNDDISHRSFSNLFIKSSYDENTNSLIMHRNLRSGSSHYYMIHKLLTNDNEKIEYETNRANFFGKSHDATKPEGLNKRLTNFVGTALDPIVSMRQRIEVEPNKETSVYIIYGFGKSKNQVLDIVKTYKDERTIKELAFDMSTLMGNAITKMSSITGRDMRLYNTMLNYLYQTSHLSINEERIELQRKNHLNQTSLWKFGISGDRPVILLDALDIIDINLVKELLHAFEYFKNKALFIDLVIINSCNEESAKVINKEIQNEKYRMYALSNFGRTPGAIHVLDSADISDEEHNLLKIIARLYIDSNKHISLEEYIIELQQLNKVNICDKFKVVESGTIPYDKDKIKFYNGYGGFINNGKSYIIINNNIPTIWQHIICNRNFGSIVTNNKTGFTYAINSREFKLTSWTNDTIINDLSEDIIINDTKLNYSLIEYGFGYSKYRGKLKNLDIELTEFTSVSDSIKFYKMKFKNTGAKKQRVALRYWMNPCLGVTEDKTARHILSDFSEKDNCMFLRNVYNQHFGDQTAFISATLPIETVYMNRVLKKEVDTSFYVEDEFETAFMLGVGDSFKKYQDIVKVNEEYNNTIKYWEDTLGSIKVKTPDDSFNYMVNGWLLYQTIASRVFAKSSFYQVGGAYGYRDQLQDSMNICTVHPDITRAQILWNAKHQFKEGDVLHWWHREAMIGLRSLYKDDYLWLITAVNEYLNITEDYTILDEQVTFVEGDKLNPGEHEKGISFWYTEETISLYEHTKLAIDTSINDIAENGLPRMGGGDWNDGMNMIGVNGKGTSVWLGFFLYQNIDKFIKYSKKHIKDFDEKPYIETMNKLKESLNTIAWDGDYYLRAFFDNGASIGGKGNTECSIDLISQSFSILTDVAPSYRIDSIINAVETKLVDKDLKIIKLLSPPFEKNANNPGYIMSYPKGIRENGGQYTHATSWYIQALIKLGYVDRAFEYYQMINPINRTKTKEGVLQYKGEPYVLPADIYSNEFHLARAGWTWYTGTSGWYYRIALIDILGFNKRGNKLFIEPNIPTNWDKYSINYKYKKTTYNINVVRIKSKDYMELDGKKLKEKYIPLKDDGKEHVVIYYI